jgi:hypothetical protein
MPRIRTLKPEILEDAATAGLSDAAFRLFVSLIVLADDYGNVRADARWLLGQVWWAHGTSPRVAEFLRETSDVGLVGVYTVRGQIYASILGWGKHQRIDNAGKARVPSPNDAEAQPFVFDAREAREDLPIFAASRGEIPLDPDLRPPTSDQDPDGEPAAERGVKPKSRKSRLSASWQPNETAVEKARKLGLNLKAEADRFRDHHVAKGSLFVDWDAAFRTWLGNAQRFAARGGSYAPRNNPTETALESLREAEERARAGARAVGPFADDVPHAAEVR